MFEAVFNNLDSTLRKDAGCSSELDYIEQTSWVLFLKYLDDYEKDKATSAKLSGKSYAPIIAKQYRWATWAAPKTEEGKIDHNAALSGDDLKEFVDKQLFPYLTKFRTEADNANTLEYKIGEIFGEIKNKLQSGYGLRDVINKVDALRFRSNKEKHEMSSLYEDKIKNMGNAGRNGGEYYTPRPLIKTIVEVVAPKVGNKVYDGAAGSAGFLCEAYDYMLRIDGLTGREYDALQQKTFYGKEKKSLAYIIGIMNMILHGIEAPNILHTNTLSENIADIQEKDRMDVVLANPPFGGSERAEIQENFPIRTSETAYLFLQHFIKILRAGGRCGVVVTNTILSGMDNASVALRKQLLEECNLHSILELPQKTFSCAGVETVVLFFDKGVATQNVWYYQLNLDRKLGKTNPLNEQDLADFKSLSKTKSDSENSWTVSIDDIDKNTWDLSSKNPNAEDASEKRSPVEILAEIDALNKRSAAVMVQLKKLYHIERIGKVFYEKTAVSTSQEVSLMNLGYIKTGVKKYSGLKRYFSTGSIKGNSFSHEGEYSYGDRPSRANREVQENDILQARMQDTNKALLVSKDMAKCLFSTGFIHFRTDKEKVMPKFLYYFLSSGLFLDEKDNLCSGSTQKSVNDKSLKKIFLSIPSLPIQKQIVEKLDAAFADIGEAIDATQSQDANLVALKSSILNQAFSADSHKEVA